MTLFVDISFALLDTCVYVQKMCMVAGAGLEQKKIQLVCIAFMSNLFNVILSALLIA